VLRELADVIVRPLSVTLECHSNWESYLKTGREKIPLLSLRRTNKKDSANYRPVSCPPVAGKVVEKILLESVSKPVEDKVIGSSQCGFAKAKSCLTNLSCLPQ